MIRSADPPTPPDTREKYPHPPHHHSRRARAAGVDARVPPSPGPRHGRCHLPPLPCSLRASISSAGAPFSLDPDQLPVWCRILSLSDAVLPASLFYHLLLVLSPSTTRHRHCRPATLEARPAVRGGLSLFPVLPPAGADIQPGRGDPLVGFRLVSGLCRRRR